MNDSPDNPEKTQQKPGGRIEHLNHRQNAGAIGAPERNVMKDNPDKPKRIHQEPAEIISEKRTPTEAMEKGESTGVTRVTGDKIK